MTKEMRLGTRMVLVNFGAVGLTLAVAAAIGGVHPRTAQGIPPTSLLMLPILAAAYFGRLIPGLVASLTASLATALLFVDPSDALPWLRPAALLVVGTVMSTAIEALHRSRIQTDTEKHAAIESNTRFTRLFHASPIAMCLSRIDDGTVAETNAAFRELMSLSTSQIVGRTAEQAGLVFDAAQRADLISKMRGRGWVRDAEIIVETRKGRHDISVSSETIDLAGTKYSLATFIDLTERRRAELEAKQSQERFRELAENVQEVFWVCDAGGTKMQYTNPAYERVFCRSAAALEHDPLDWMNVVHPDDRARIAALMTRPVEDRAEMQFQIVLPDHTLRTLRSRFFPIRDGAGAVVRIAGMTTDITKQLELEEQVRQAQKLESLGLLAGGVAHDFNNILAVIGSNISMLGETAGADDKELVDEVEKAVTRGASLTRQLLAFSRRQVIEPKILDVNRIVEDTRKMLRRMVGEDIQLSCSLDPELHHVMMDSGALVQVLMNLAVNARDAMPRGGSLSVTTRNTGDEVLIEVNDTGCGMPHEVVSRIFEPFFTTKGIGKGTGLGLSVVHGIVEQAGGRIEVDSHVGVGTTFAVHLPITADAVSANDKIDADACDGAEKILLVDDDVFVRTSAARALRTQGYTVIEAGDGASALEILVEDAHTIALLVTDVVMPGMDGRQLVEAARSRRPSLRVLFTSGYTDDAVLHHGVRRDEVAFLEKPFRTRQLAGRVRRLLDAREPVAR